MRGIPRYTLVWGAHYTLGARYLLKNTVNISRCPLFCDKIALNFMNMKFIWRRSLSTFCTEFGLFRISMLESSETF